MAVDGTPQPSGNEFLVNTTTLNAQTNAAIAGLADGGLVVAWQSDSGDDTGRLGIFAQRYDASGNKVGAQTLIFRLINQTEPSVAALTDGGFVVTFDASPPPAPTYLGYDIRFAHFNADGTRSNGVVTDYNGLGDFASSVVGLPDGGFVASWQSEQVDGTCDILAQRYDASGARVGSAVQVNSTVADSQFAPHVAVLEGGGFVVAWQSEAQDGSGLGIFGQRFDANGAAVGTEFQINTYTSNDQMNASVGGLSAGGFVVAWESTGQDGSSGGIYGQIYDGSGNRVGGEFPINTYTSNGQGSPRVAAFPDGSFVVVWQSAEQDGSGDGVYGQLFSGTGQKIGQEFLINDTVEGNQVDPVVTVVGPNDFEVAWTSGGDIFARHFALSPSNHGPVASDVSASVNENAASVLLNGAYADSDAADTFTFSADTAETVGLVTNNNDGTFTYGPNGKFESLGVGESATDTFTYTVTDNHGASSTATATVTIHGENDAPSALPDAMVVQKGTVVTANPEHGVLVNDSDPDKHDTLHVSKVNGQSINVGHATTGAYGTLTLNANGSYSYSANKNIPGLTNKGGVQDHFTYSVDDGHGGTASSTLTVTVQTQQALNHAPTLSINPLDATKDEGSNGPTPFTFVVTRDDNASVSTTVDWIAGPANGVTADALDFIGGAFPTGTVTFSAGEVSKTITVSIQGDTLYESNGKTENFVVALSNPSSGATISAGHDSAVGHIHNDDAPLQTAAKIFSALGTDGEIVALAQLAQAAYHLVPGQELTGPGINLLNPDAEVSYNFLPAGLQILSIADLSLPAPILNDPEFPNFPTNGLIDGIYLHGNAAALVARSSDSVFIAFRGTNDLDHTPSETEIAMAFVPFGSGTPDLKDWGHMNNYYDLLSPLINSLNDYINDPSNGVRHVYVTGHSLGAAMAQHFVTEHTNDQRFQAVTFSSPGYNSVVGHGTHADDPRILNIHVDGDPIQAAYPFDQLIGDDYVIYGAQHIEAGGPHDMALYYTVAQFLNNNYPLPLQTLPLQSIATNGIADTVNVFADIASQAAGPPPTSVTWQVSLPSGTIIPIPGTPGIDYMKGGPGNDEIIGGAGNDTFVFGTGRDTIIDFQSGQDVIELNKSLFKNFHAVLANAQDDGIGDTVITNPLNHYDSITLQGVTPTHLHAYDFHIA